VETRQKQSRPLVEDLHAYLREQSSAFARHDLVKAINYILKRWPAFTLFWTMAVFAFPTMPPSAA